MTLEAQVAKLGRRSQLAGMLSLLGAVLIVGALLASYSELRALETRKATLAAEVAKLEAQKVGLRKDNATLYDVINKASIKLATGATPAASNAAAATLLIGAPPSAGDMPVRRVYFQARATNQQPLFRRCADNLLKAGYRVPKLELVPQTGPAVSTVRYFRPTERDEALKVVEDLGDCAGTQFAVVQIGGYEQSPLVKPHQFEVWFAKDLKGPGAPAA
jgi:hypothetical protein